MSRTAEYVEQVISSWSRLYAARKELLKTWRSVWDIPMRDNVPQVLLESIAPGSRVLEIGASDRNLEALLTGKISGIVYKSMDIDRETRQDYYALEDVKETFDAVLMVEVVEHLPFAQAVRLLGTAFDLLAPGGKAIITTPNVAHPTHFYRDPTHVTAWSHEGLGGVLTALDFRVEGMYRIYDAPVAEKLFHKYLNYPSHRALGVDFAHTLVVVASRDSD